ncbi:hypothetical protein C8N32_1561 [Rhodovulum imhoffii]|uniref:Uncharacterized protein n=1 Tax=Rhodovulum imhoffii TaxID=365340 RepID=A0A2T5B310_9RHOB|nr:hypothetical protein [Rhodovulum imhoffii]PTM93314.1 hypothetical protein C8N32_1561 [Rhodovulum imhoffii]
MQHNADALIAKLLRGVSTNHVETTRDAWRDLLRAGPNSVATVRTKLASDVWHNAPRGPVARYLGVLLMLLDELDPKSFRMEIERLSRTNLHPLHRQTLKLMSNRVAERPEVTLNNNIPVFIASDVSKPYRTKNVLKKWSCFLPQDALENVTRIDVIRSQPQLDYLGLYNLFFSGIVLAWPEQNVNVITRWLIALRSEFTFYHEVGHHVLGHAEGGQVAEQEKQANAYAAKIMRKSHPVLMTAAKLFVRASRLLRRKDSNKSGN